MGFNLLGDVNDGWFAQLAHGCEDFSKSCLNGISGSSRWGDQFYGTMAAKADTYVQGVNNAAIQGALANGATPMQAYSAGSAEMDRLANPQNLSDLGNLFGAGTNVGVGTVRQTIHDGITAGGVDWTTILPWILGGTAVIGGGILLANSMGGSPSKDADEEEEVRAPATGFAGGRRHGLGT